MSSNSAIEWTEATWNPIAGCTPVSPGCMHCYAATMAHRLDAMGQEKYRGLTVLRNGIRTFNGKINLDEAALLIPLKRKKPTMYFVNSMSDLFHKDVPFEFVDKVFAVMALCPQHTFQVLTKRPERMAEYFGRLRERGDGASYLHIVKVMQRDHDGDTIYRALKDQPITEWPLRNVWLGTSVENQEQADKRIPHLLKCPAAVRFLSVEPMLGPVDVGGACHRARCAELESMISRPHVADALACTAEILDGIHWVIVGGESGPGARECSLEWIASIVNQCADVGVACFVKQLGSNPRGGHLRFPATDSKGGDISEFPESVRVRQFPVTEGAPHA